MVKFKVIEVFLNKKVMDNNIFIVVILFDIIVGGLVIVFYKYRGEKS